MSYVITPTIGVSLTQLGLGKDYEDTPAYALGTKVIANDGVYQYVQASAAVAQYALVKIANDFTVAEATTTLLPNTEPAKVGIAQIALAEDEYGWVFVGPGLATVKAAASCVHNVKLYTTATAGVVDDASTTLVNGLKLVATITSATSTACVAECELGTVLA